ncbi:major facilitator superfamily protein [mine drainage metagenome]|uniref:Major facilitator superfamily protein n=1 Tax=mine drainage metagenome TaxID=410659 RepID=A0A1J5S2P3_9ZZZZ
MPHHPSQTSASTRLPRTVWLLGWVSLFMDMSSELIHAVLPVYMTTVLGLSVLTVGFVEGIAEATASVLKAFSGALSDRLGRRKALAVLGYGLSALTKPLFPLASGAAEVIAARFIDRIGKGIRGAPRDALLADATPEPLRNAAYGLRQSMDTVGAFLGPLAAIALLWWLHDRLRLLLWFGVLPALIAVGILALGVREPEGLRARAPCAREAGSGQAPRFAAARALPPAYWGVVAMAGVFTLARLSEAFLVLRAQQQGVALLWIPLVTLAFSLVYALSAYPSGLLAQRYGRRVPLLTGMAVLLVSMLLLALPGMPALWLGVALYGLHLGLTQGVFAAAVAASAPIALRGTAFGLYYLIIGLLQLLAGLGAGWLWQHFGAQAAFGAGAAMAAAALLLAALRAGGGARSG